MSITLLIKFMSDWSKLKEFICGSRGGGRGAGIVKFTIYQVHLGFRNINFRHISQVYYFKQLNINDIR